MAVTPLSSQYTGPLGLPAVDHVDTAIFNARYFRDCMGCTFCHDSCCGWGADVDLIKRDALLAEGQALADFTGRPMETWFRDGVYGDDEVPGGGYVRTSVERGGCIFLSRHGRGCMIHAYALAKGEPYQRLKPMVCSLFPVTWDRGVLRVSAELAHDTLTCAGDGDTAYRGAREDLAALFGPALVAELDRLEAEAEPETKTNT